jgi:RNA polymerase sigma factor (sigma-70 family)
MTTSVASRNPIVRGAWQTVPYFVIKSTTVDDEALLQAWRAGDQRAGRELLSRLLPTLRCYFVNKVDEPADVEDLVHETLLACLEGSDRYAERGPFRGYVLGIARYKLIKHWRRRVRWRAEDIEERSIASLGAGPSSIIAQFENGQRLLAALREIKLKHQEVLELYYWEKLNARELGELFGIGEDTARSRINRAKEALKKKFGELEGSGAPGEYSTTDFDGWALRVRPSFDSPGGDGHQ